MDTYAATAAEDIYTDSNARNSFTAKGWEKRKPDNKVCIFLGAFVDNMLGYPAC